MERSCQVSPWSFRVKQEDSDQITQDSRQQQDITDVEEDRLNTEDQLFYCGSLIHWKAVFGFDSNHVTAGWDYKDNNSPDASKGQD